MSKCLVLGANGFIGSHIVDSLVSAGENVRAFDRFGTQLRNFKTHPSIEDMSGDFLYRKDLAKALQDVDYVFHFISTTTPASAENNPLIDIETNLKMSVELFEECVTHKVKKVIFASSSSIYGDINTDTPIDEVAVPEPVSPYTIGKLTIEHYLRYFKRKFDLDSVTYRISNPYGERHSIVSKQGVVPIFLHHIAKGEPIAVMGDGTMIRDYLYVGDVASLIAKTYKNTSQPIYNLGSGKGESVNQLIDVIKKVTGRPVDIEFKPKPATFVQRVVLDISRFRSEFSLAPQTTLEEGIRKTWEYILENERSANP